MKKTPKQKVEEVFGKNADKYVTSNSHAKGDDLPLLVDWLKPEKTWKVLDIATGGGHVTKTLAPHVATVFSTDLTRAMLENTAKHLRHNFDNIEYVVADAEALPFLTETFDAAVCRIAPHHFPQPDRFISEVAKVLKTGGKFILIDNGGVYEYDGTIKRPQPFSVLIKSGMGHAAEGKWNERTEVGRSAEDV